MGEMVETEISLKDALSERVFLILFKDLSLLISQTRDDFSYYFHPPVILHLSSFLKNS
jgi:hypothetical protein